MNEVEMLIAFTKLMAEFNETQAKIKSCTDNNAKIVQLLILNSIAFDIVFIMIKAKYSSDNILQFMASVHSFINDNKV